MLILLEKNTPNNANHSARVNTPSRRADYRTPLSPQAVALLTGSQSKNTSALCKKLGSRAAAVFDAIFSSLNIPAEYHRLLLFLYAFSEGKDSVDVYRWQVADAFFDEVKAGDWKRASKAREQRFARIWQGFNEWQKAVGCHLILYFPGTKFGEQSERGRFNLKPFLDLFARIYTESRSTSAFQDERKRKLYEVTERIILNEFENLPLPRKRAGRSMGKEQKNQREASIICTRTKKLVAQLSADEATKLAERLLEQFPLDFISLLKKKDGEICGADSQPEQVLYQNCTNDVENKELAEKLDALVDGKTPSEFLPSEAQERPAIGQPNEDFIREAFPQADQPTARQLRFLRLYRVDGASLTFAEASARIAELKASGAEPLATDSQRSLLARAGVDAEGLTIREASERISQCYADGSFLPGDWLSLAQLRADDSKARQTGTKQRYRCPMCSDGRKNRKERCLRVNLSKNRYSCFHCKTWGFIREGFTGAANTSARSFPALPPAEPTTEQIAADKRWRRRFESAKPITGTDGAVYLERRGIPADVARVAGVRFGTWWKRNDDANKPEPFAAVIFPAVNQFGELVSASARAVTGDTKRTAASLETGVFLSSSDAMKSNRLAICEASFDALALEAAGLPAIALFGTSWPEWLPKVLAGKTVLIATDADKPGDECAARFTEALQGLATVRRLRPQGGKDWAEVLRQHGQASIQAQIECALGCAEPGSFDDVEGF